jgi:hypothetical protein
MFRQPRLLPVTWQPVAASAFAADAAAAVDMSLLLQTVDCSLWKMALRSAAAAAVER